ncbi:MAG: stage II sporulation protein M [Actinobacteria bacterium]|nr:stage II sporulation protein M [Actinomycetota bacterium]
MRIDYFINERSARWTELQELMSDCHGKVARLNPSKMLRLGRLYRSVSADLALARREFPDAPLTRQLTLLVARAHGIVYGSSIRQGSFRNFVSRRFWQSVLEGGWMLVLPVGLLVAFSGIGFLWARADPSQAMSFLSIHISAHPGHGGMVGLPVPARAPLATEIFTNNIVVAFTALAGGMTMGILTTIVLAYNGAMLGIVASTLIREGYGGELVRLIAPHGFLELSCIVVAASTGFRLAKAIVQPGNMPRLKSLQATGQLVIDTILGVACLLVIAGLVEGFITPENLPIGASLAIGITLAGTFWILVGVRGRLGNVE